MRFISHLILLLAVTATLAFAQAQQPQRPSDDELNAMFATVTAQRNAAQDQVVQLAGRIAALEAKLKDAEKSCKPEAAKK